VADLLGALFRLCDVQWWRKKQNNGNIHQKKSWCRLGCSLTQRINHILLYKYSKANGMMGWMELLETDFMNHLLDLKLDSWLAMWLHTLYLLVGFLLCVHLQSLVPEVFIFYCRNFPYCVSHYNWMIPKKENQEGRLDEEY
jgi:hypothetical protein